MLRPIAAAALLFAPLLLSGCFGCPDDGPWETSWTEPGLYPLLLDGPLPEGWQRGQVAGTDTVWSIPDSVVARRWGAENLGIFQFTQNIRDGGIATAREFLYATPGTMGALVSADKDEEQIQALYDGFAGILFGQGHPDIVARWPEFWSSRIHDPDFSAPRTRIVRYEIQIEDVPGLLAFFGEVEERLTLVTRQEPFEQLALGEFEFGLAYAHTLVSKASAEPYAEVLVDARNWTRLMVSQTGLMKPVGSAAKELVDGYLAELGSPGPSRWQGEFKIAVSC